MIGVTISISGVDELISRIETGVNDLQGIANDVVEEVALEILDDAQAFCPVNTGLLQSSIQITMIGSTAEIGTDVYYAVYVEFGTVNMAAEPFLTPAFELHKDELNSLLAEMIMGAFA